jgi:hypothetical protein
MLIRFYYLRHSFESWDSFLLVYLQHVGFLSFKNLASVFDEETCRATLSTIDICAKSLRDKGRYSYIAEAIFTVLRDTIRSSSTQLLKGVGILLRKRRGRNFQLDRSSQDTRSKS